MLHEFRVRRKGNTCKTLRPNRDEHVRGYLRCLELVPVVQEVRAAHERLAAAQLGDLAPRIVEHGACVPADHVRIELRQVEVLRFLLRGVLHSALAKDLSEGLLLRRVLQLTRDFRCLLDCLFGNLHGDSLRRCLLVRQCAHLSRGSAAFDAQVPWRARQRHTARGSEEAGVIVRDSLAANATAGTRQTRAPCCARRRCNHL